MEADSRSFLSAVKLEISPARSRLYAVMCTIGVDDDWRWMTSHYLRSTGDAGPIILLVCVWPNEMEIAWSEIDTNIYSRTKNPFRTVSKRIDWSRGDPACLL